MSLHPASSQPDGFAESTTTSDVLAILVEVLHIHEDEALPGARLVDDLGARADEIALLRRTLEQHYGIAIPSGAVLKWSQVADVVAYILGRVDGAQAGV